MALENIETFPPSREKSKRTYIYIFGILFFVVMASLLFFAFSGNLTKITGFATHNAPFQGIYIESETNIPKGMFEIDGEVQEITLKTKTSSAKLFVGDNSYSLNEIQNPRILIDGFSGELIFDESEILGLDGKATTIKINGVPTKSLDGRKINLELGSKVRYESLEISEAFLSERGFNATGKIILEDKATFELEKEHIKIGKFLGKIVAGEEIFSEKRVLKLQGRTENLEIKGLIETQ